eukprot:scaffold97333_cov45-Attheya_sp.AAC.3
MTGMFSRRGVLEREGNHADGRTDREASADPVPKSKNVGLGNAKGSGLVNGRGDGYDVLGDNVRLTGFDPGAAKAVQKPLAGRPGVEHGFGRGKGLTNDHHHGFLRVQVAGAEFKVHGVDVGQETEGASLCSSGRFGVAAQGFVHKLGSQLRSANANADVILERLARDTRECAAANLFRKGLHLVPDGVHVLEHLCALRGVDGRVVVALGHAKCVMEDRAALRDVDGLARAHGGSLFREAHLVGQVVQDLHGLPRHLLPRVIQNDFVLTSARVRGHQSGTPRRVATQVSQMQLFIALEGRCCRLQRRELRHIRTLHREIRSRQIRST